jgi:hypothetical protein
MACVWFLVSGLLVVAIACACKRWVLMFVFNMCVPFFSVKTWVWQIYIEFQSFSLCLAVLILADDDVYLRSYDSAVCFARPGAAFVETKNSIIEIKVTLHHL